MLSRFAKRFIYPMVRAVAVIQWVILVFGSGCQLKLIGQEQLAETRLETANLAVTSPAALSLSPASYEFPAAIVGSRWQSTFTVTNTGGETATALSISGLAAPFSYLGGAYPGTGGTCATTLASGASCTVVLTYSPTATVSSSASLTLAHAGGTAGVSLATDSAASTLSPPAATFTWNGPALSWEFTGRSVHGGLDVDGDSVPDAIFGEHWVNGNQVDAGRAKLINGATGATMFTVNGSVASGYLGTAVALYPDTNGDGRAEFIVSETGTENGGEAAGTNRGRVRVFSGADGTTILYTITGGSGDELGRTVAVLGDLNGDGKREILVGAESANAGGTDRGFVNVYSGADFSTKLFDDDVDGYSFKGTIDSEYFGSAIAAAGDVNGDGIDDFIIGSGAAASGGTLRGKYAVHSGATGAVLYSANGTADNFRLGNSVCGLGDLNADGYAEFMINEGGEGYPTPPVVMRSYIFSGRSGALLDTIDSASLNDPSFGCANLGDVDGDGVSDFALGEESFNGAGSGRGRVRVFSGATRTLYYTITGAADNDAFGAFISAVGDVNGDGRGELLIGSPGRSPAGGGGGTTASGRVEFFLSP